jgi:hypothetical protein
VIIVSGLLAALGFGYQTRMSARAARSTGMVAAVVGVALCSAALADVQPGCDWCRHDGWGGGTSPSPIFLVWLVGIVGIGSFRAARAILAGRKPSGKDDDGWASISGNRTPQATGVAATNGLSVIGGISQRSWGRISWPMCRATVTENGVVFEARGPLWFVAPPFTLLFSEIRSAETPQAPGLAGLYIYTAVEGFEKVLFSGWPTSIRMFEDALCDHQVAITRRGR